MIETRIISRFDELTEQLAQKAATLAAACMTSRKLAQKSDPARWRTASLVWPLFAKG